MFKSIQRDKLADMIVQTYMRKNHTECIVKGLVICGPAEVKSGVMETDLFKQYFSNKVIAVVSTDVIDERTVYSVYEQCSDKLNPLDDSKKIMTEFNGLVARASEKLTFGEEVYKGLEENTIEKLIISDVLYKEIKETLAQYQKCQVHVVPEHHLTQYGNLVGIKYY